MIRKIYLIFYDFFDAKETNGNIDVILKNYNSFMKKNLSRRTKPLSLPREVANTIGEYLTFLDW